MPERILRVRISGPDRRVREFLRAHPVEPQAIQSAGDILSFEAFVTEDWHARASGFGIRSEVLFDGTARARARQREVGKGNRFEGGKFPPGLGTKTH
jgi:hypothetical protein